MQEVQRLISLYHTGYQVCLGIAAAAFVLTVFLFFKFRIPTLFAAKTGIAKRRTIREIEENNAKTGRLRTPLELGDAEVRRGVSITQEEKKRITDSLSVRMNGKSRKLGTQKHAEIKDYPIRFVIEKEIILTHSDEIL